MGLVVVGGLGCAGAQPGPVAALDDYSAALEARNYDRAYALMSEDIRRRLSKDEFVRLMNENPAEVRQTASRLRERYRELAIKAELRYGVGDELALVLEDGAWRIATNPIAFYLQTTPRDALRSFVRAYRLKRWDVMLKLIPEQYAARMTVDTVKQQFEGPRADEVELMMQQLEANIDAPIKIKGNEARMSYADAEVTFVREDEAWKIQDPD
jgi:GGDEF domain-containing protein